MPWMGTSASKRNRTIARLLSQTFKRKKEKEKGHKKKKKKKERNNPYLSSSPRLRFDGVTLEADFAEDPLALGPRARGVAGGAPLLSILALWLDIENEACAIWRILIRRSWIARGVGENPFSLAEMEREVQLVDLTFSICVCVRARTQ